jgi:ABC-type transporter Mla subunit MlaD
MRANGTSQHKDLVKEINALKVQLKKLSAALETETNDGVNRAMGAIEAKSKEAIDDAIAAAQDFIDDYADTVRGAAAALGKKSERIREAATDSLVEAVETRPLATLAALLGLGFLAGYLCRRA